MIWLDKKERYQGAKDFIHRIHLRLSAKYSQTLIRKHPSCYLLQLTSRNNLSIKCSVLWARLSLPTSSPRGHSPDGLPPSPTGTPTLPAGGNTATSTMTCVRPSESNRSLASLLIFLFPSGRGKPSSATRALVCVRTLASIYLLLTRLWAVCPLLNNTTAPIVSNGLRNKACSMPPFQKINGHRNLRYFQSLCDPPNDVCLHLHFTRITVI